MVSPADKGRFARHLLLPEIGEAGQERLCAARLYVPASADPRAAAAAARYLERAGFDLSASENDQGGIPLPSPATVRRLAGSSELEGAAAALAGAFAAVEAIKRVLGVGTPADMPALTLVSEAAP